MSALTDAERHTSLAETAEALSALLVVIVVGASLALLSLTLIGLASLFAILPSTHSRRGPGPPVPTGRRGEAGRRRKLPDVGGPSAFRSPIMSWTELKQRAKPGASLKLARAQGGLRLSVCLSGDFAASLDWKTGDRATLFVGAGEDAGKLRLLRGATGNVAVNAMKKTLRILFPRVAGLGDAPRPVIRVDAARVDENTVDITFGNWPARDSDDEEDEERVAQAAPRPAANGHVNGELVLERQGVRLNLAPDEEEISHRGKTMELAGKQAPLVAALLRAMPLPVDRGHIIKTVWGGKPPPSADNGLSVLLTGLAAPLAGVGLRAESIKGVGIKLVKLP